MRRGTGRNRHQGTGAPVQREPVPWLNLFLAALPCSLAGLGVLLLPTMFSFGPCGSGRCMTDPLAGLLRTLLPMQGWSNLEILGSFGGLVGGLVPLFWWCFLRKRSSG